MLYNNFSQQISRSHLLYNVASYYKRIVRRNSAYLIANIKKLIVLPSHMLVKFNIITLSLSNIMYIRKFKVFNKGRYSRTRQLYRTGVYWCLFLNIILVVALYFWFYRFSMNFGYLWWFFFLFVAYLFFARSISYKIICVLRFTTISYYYIINNFVNYVMSVRKLLNTFTL